MFEFLELRPIIVAIAGPNGAGKTTFYRAFLGETALHFVNADQIASDLHLDAYKAAELSSRIRANLLQLGDSFIFETVFSDPIGEKLSFLSDAHARGYTVVLIFIGISNPERSEERVAMRCYQGEHDVPREKLYSRFPRTMLNLQKAIEKLPFVLVYDNDDLENPFRFVAFFENGVLARRISQFPSWFRKVYSPTNS